ncbi:MULTISPECIES: DNA replication/repair protein RecF [unclassified Vibrio]|uniref:DNA replication and repair protein RecF n=1 Tax=Vibrio sp. HB236076 TaxID=3232307 RepID=A0AB39HCB8_9VIBR|nr:DNA replication/repair protein RecF [Vibrio sp. HB161653]MDP5255689.1 DNA replication/repair protein RecF [Vibrio sp. HB161653]
MAIKRLLIQQFRNIKACDLSPSSGFNFLIGPNGSGKTSVLEAIYLLGHGRSFKSNLTSRIIAHHSDELFIHGRLSMQNDWSTVEQSSVETDSSSSPVAERDVMAVNEPMPKHAMSSEASEEMSDDASLVVGDESKNNRALWSDSALMATPSSVEMPIGLNKKRDGSTLIKISGQSGQKMAQLAEVLPLQLIHTEGFELVTEGPKLRRAFIDWGVFHTQPQFFDTWGRFKRLNKQRNALLKNARSYRELSYWDRELAELAEQISQWRARYLEAFIPQALTLCEGFLPEYEMSFSYSRGWDKDTDYAELLADNFERDQNMGYTVSGPNKADLRIKANGTPAEDILSRGQLKLLVCALRVAQGQHLSSVTEKRCIYLIDDFASELDSTRRQRLAECFKQMQTQVFVSSITQAQISDMIMPNSKMFYVEHGTIEQG